MAVEPNPIPPQSAVGNPGLWRKRLDLEQRWRLHEGTEEDFTTRRKRWLARLVRIGLTPLGLYRRGRRNTWQPQLEHHTFHFDHLPRGLHGLRILHLSDFHFSSKDQTHVDAIARLIRGLEVDLCLITGDYKFGHYGPVEHVGPSMAQILGGLHAQHGVFSVLGNHDVGAVVQILEASSVRMLVNAGAQLCIHGAPLWIAGVDDPHKFQCDDLDAALQGAPANAFKILLAHTPEIIPQAEAAGISLYLTGHTHGGQICFPLIGALTMNTRCHRRYTRGAWRHGAMQGYTVRGLGTSDLPLRFLCLPEAMLLTLQPTSTETSV